MNSPRRVAIVAGNRIPFARSNTAYAEASNQVMLTAAIAGLVEKSGLKAGVDFLLAYSPEREDPGNPKFETNVSKGSPIKI